MSKATKFLERTSCSDQDEFGELLEFISINEAFTALEIKELEILEFLKGVLEGSNGTNTIELTIDEKIKNLTNRLKNIKL